MPEAYLQKLEKKLKMFKLNNQIQDIEIQNDIDIGSLTTMKLPINGDLAIVKSEYALVSLLKELQTRNYKFHMIGLGANQVITKTNNILFVRLLWGEHDRHQLKDEYYFSASTPLTVLISTAMHHGLKGWDVLTGIPATVGGAVCMNAGTSLGEFSEIIKNVRVLTKNLEIEVRDNQKGSFFYRKYHDLKEDEIILGATVKNLGIDQEIKIKIKKYLDMRNNSQPLKEKTCGCVFKNHSTALAGATIDQLGLKGLTVGGLRVSTVHANFIENFKCGTVDDFLELTKQIQLAMKNELGIEFELEVKVY